ncbi:MAG: hypothetical protein SFV18_20815 [Bryobacteraceae bacterium]|nr:hypothetical protein [Bryobacteraceae bacterium]
MTNGDGESLEMRALRGALRNLRPRRVPERLTVALRVTASQERMRRLRRINWASAVRHAVEDANLWFNNLLKPLALPFAGGVTTAAMFFSMFVSTYPLRGRMIDADVPTVLYTEAAFKSMVPIEFSDDDLIVDLLVGNEGRVLDYRIVGGGGAKDPSMRRAMVNLMLFSEFKPATAFGQPVSGRIRVSFRRGHIDVRG